MYRVCEVCGRQEEIEQENNEFEILDVCPECSNDRMVIPTMEQ